MDALQSDVLEQLEAWKDNGQMRSLDPSDQMWCARTKYELQRAVEDNELLSGDKLRAIARRLHALSSRLSQRPRLNVPRTTSSTAIVAVGGGGSSGGRRRRTTMTTRASAAAAGTTRRRTPAAARRGRPARTTTSATSRRRATSTARAARVRAA